MAKKAADLDGLEFPRHLHGPNNTFKRVENVEEAEEAMKEGFQVDPVLTDEQQKAVDKAEDKAGPQNRTRSEVDHEGAVIQTVQQPIAGHQGNKWMASDNQPPEPPKLPEPAPEPERSKTATKKK